MICMPHCLRLCIFNESHIQSLISYSKIVNKETMWTRRSIDRRSLVPWPQPMYVCVLQLLIVSICVRVCVCVCWAIAVDHRNICTNVRTHASSTKTTHSTYALAAAQLCSNSTKRTITKTTTTATEGHLYTGRRTSEYSRMCDVRCACVCVFCGPAQYEPTHFVHNFQLRNRIFFLPSSSIKEAHAEHSTKRSGLMVWYISGKQQFFSSYVWESNDPERWWLGV